MSGSELTSLRSPRVAAARRLTKRAYRSADRRFLAEGPQAVREALGCGAALELFVTADAERRQGELLAAAPADVAISRVSGEVMGVLAQTVTPQGVVAVCRFLDADLASVLSRGPKLLAILAAVRDPGNAGTVIRTADAAGADAVVLTDDSVDVYNAKCVRASAGSLFHLPVVTGVPVTTLLGDIRAAGVRILAADGAGKHDLDDLLDCGELAAPAAWLFGNEAWGLSESTRALADETVRVPIHGRAESLNLAAATAVCLYACARAQREQRPRPNA